MLFHSRLWTRNPGTHHATRICRQHCITYLVFLFWFTLIGLPGWEATGSHFNRKEQVRDVETQTLLAGGEAKTEKKKPQTKQPKKLSKDQKPWKSQRREHRNNLDGWPERLSEKNGPIIHLAHVLRNTAEAPPYYKMKGNSSFFTSIPYIEEANSCGGFVT